MGSSLPMDINSTLRFLYTLQEINTQKELSMYKGITQDMNSKIIIFELRSLVLK